MSAYKPTSLYPSEGDDERDSLRKLNALAAKAAGVSTGEDGAPAAATTPAQANVTSAAAVILAAGAAAIVSLFNNGAQTVYFDEGGKTPVADSGGTAGPRVGDGFGKELQPGVLWESPRPVSTAIKAITETGTSKVTVTIYPA